MDVNTLPDITGKGRLEAEKGKAVIFKKDGKQVTIASASDSKSPLEILLLVGVPLNEPIARYGPLVMNSNEEIYQAVEDYQNGRLGTIDI